MRIIYASLGLCLLQFAAVDSGGIPFVYNPESSGDPTKVALLREALMHAGVSPDGIIVKSVLAKWELYRTAYKATYINKFGQSCFLKWRVNHVTGAQSPEMPICENVATGTGNEPPKIFPSHVFGG